MKWKEWEKGYEGEGWGGGELKVGEDSCGAAEAGKGVERWGKEDVKKKKTEEMNAGGG